MKLFYYKFKNLIPPIVWPVFFIGLCVRIFAWYFTYIINPDGMLYIYQAKAIYYGQWRHITACGLQFLSNYPIFIAGAYALFEDWMTAATLVSLFFGFITLVPLYGVLRCFFSDKIVVPSLLIFALIPMFVGRSADVVRGPVFWFFLILGIFFFIKQFERRNNLFVFLSSLSFLMAAWARTEGLLFIVLSFFYLFFSKQSRKVMRLFYFMLPIIFAVILCIVGAKALNVSAKSFYRLDNIKEAITEPIESYHSVRGDLSALTLQQDRTKPLRWFLPEARNFVWLIALGTFFNRFFEAVFYPFALIFLMGLSGSVKRSKQDTRVLYLFLIVAAVTILLYVRTIQTWMLYYRFMAMLVLPGFIFIGFGIEKIIHLFQERTKVTKTTIVFALCLLILVSALPKNLQKRGEDKQFIARIGELIAEREGNKQPIKIAAAYSSLGHWISFYANLNYKGAICPLKTNCNTRSYQHLVNYLEQNQITYFIYEENRWATEHFNFYQSGYEKNFREIQRWKHPDTGLVVLYAFDPKEPF